MPTPIFTDLRLEDRGKFILLEASGTYTLERAKSLFKTSIDTALQHCKSKILIDVRKVTGYIPFIDRYIFSSYVVRYFYMHASGKISSAAVIGGEPIIANNKFGEAVARNAGLNVRVFTDTQEAETWLAK